METRWSCYLERGVVYREVFSQAKLDLDVRVVDRDRAFLITTNSRLPQSALGNECKGEHYEGGVQVVHDHVA
jgi:hypothetical protein